MDFDKFSDAPNAAREEIRAALERLHLPEQIGEIDLHCPGCGYNLRGLATRGRCPECAAPAWSGFVERTLALAEPSWLAQLNSGMKWLACAGAVLTISLIVNLVSSWWFPAGQDEVMGVGLVLATVAVCVSMWKLAAPNPAHAVVNSGAFAGAIGVPRAALIVTIAGSMFACGLAARQGFNSATIATTLAASPLGIAGAVFFFLQARVIERLARSAGDEFGAGRVKQYRHGFVISWAVFFVSAVGLSWLPPVIGLATLLGAVFALMHAILIVLSPSYFGDRMKAALTTARLVRRFPDAVLDDAFQK
jgi:hypothetical protein